MMDLCESSSELECIRPTDAVLVDGPEWLEQPVIAGFVMWQILFLVGAGLLVLVIFLCCCCRFRIPRTKQEIEADYVRKKLTRKFRKQLRMLHNAELDEMDFKRALDRIRAEFKSDTESLAQSEVLSVGTGSSCPTPTYRKGSEIHFALSLEDIEAQARSTFRGRLTRCWDDLLFKMGSTKNKEKSPLPEQRPVQPSSEAHEINIQLVGQGMVARGV